MKKYVYNLLIALFAISTFAFTSCSNDEEDGEIVGSVVGTWECTLFESSNLFQPQKQYIQFNENGLYKEVNIYVDETDVITGKWKQTGNKIRVDGDGDTPSVTTEVTHLTDSELTLVTLGIPMSYKRVSDFEIDGY